MLFVVNKKTFQGGGGGTQREQRGNIYMSTMQRGQFYEIVLTVSGTACKCGRGFELRITENKSSRSWPARDTDPGLPNCESDALSRRNYYKQHFKTLLYTLTFFSFLQTVWMTQYCSYPPAECH